MVTEANGAVLGKAPPIDLGCGPGKIWLGSDQSMAARHLCSLVVSTLDFSCVCHSAMLPCRGGQSIRELARVGPAASDMEDPLPHQTLRCRDRHL